jgi:hypothetical protein
MQNIFLMVRTSVLDELFTYLFVFKTFLHPWTEVK